MDRPGRTNGAARAGGGRALAGHVLLAILVVGAALVAPLAWDAIRDAPKERQAAKAVLDSTARRAPGRPLPDPAPAPASAPVIEAPPSAGVPPAGREEVGRRLVELGIEPRGLDTWFEVDGQSVLRFRVDGRRAPEVWELLRREVARLGRWPVVIGPPAGQATLPEPLQPGDSVASILAAASALDPAAVLKERIEMLTDDGDSDIPRGRWPDEGRPLKSISVHIGLHTREPLPEVDVALAPTTNGWEVPAWICFGGFNECPAPEEHVAILRWWGSRFGVELAAMNHATLELVGARPPSGRKELLDLAREQFWYCPDLVWEEMDTLDALAARLEGSTVWWLWWD